MQKKYIVEGNLKDDTGYHTTGDIILMDEDQAAPLVAIGRLKPAVEDITPPSAPDPDQPDGFPDHSLDTKQPEDPPANEQTPALVNPASAPTTNPVPSQAPANPTPEQIAKDLAQLG